MSLREWVAVSNSSWSRVPRGRRHVCHLAHLENLLTSCPYLGVKLSYVCLMFALWKRKLKKRIGKVLGVFHYYIVDRYSGDITMQILHNIRSRRTKEKESVCGKWSSVCSGLMIVVLCAPLCRSSSQSAVSGWPPLLSRPGLSYLASNLLNSLHVLAAGVGGGDVALRRCPQYH